MFVAYSSSLQFICFYSEILCPDNSVVLVQGEEGALSMTTRLKSANASKGLPVNYCSGFRSSVSAAALEADGV